MTSREAVRWTRRSAVSQIPVNMPWMSNMSTCCIVYTTASIVAGIESRVVACEKAAIITMSNSENYLYDYYSLMFILLNS